MINRQRLILKSNWGGTFEGLKPHHITGAETAMTLFAMEKLKEHKEREIKGEMKSFFKLLFHFSYDNMILYARSKVLNRAIKNAKLRAKIENKKVYVFRDSLIGFKTLSSTDVKFNKKIRVMKKDIDFMELENISAFIAYPPKRK